MKARKLIESSSFAPEHLKVIFQVFDEAWDEMAPSFGKNASVIESTRLRLADAVLKAAEVTLVPEALKRQALVAFAGTTKKVNGGSI